MKRVAPSAEENKAPILAVMKEFFPDSGELLEIASGTGQHASFFARAFPEINWQCSDIDPVQIDSIEAYVEESNLRNLKPPKYIDIQNFKWEGHPQDILVCNNMIHISPWEAGCRLFRAAGELLKAEGLLFMYGPFLFADRESAQSNVDFDKYLKSENSEWGVRALDLVQSEAEKNGLGLEKLVEMPKDNCSLLFRKNQR